MNHLVAFLILAVGISLSQLFPFPQDRPLLETWSDPTDMREAIYVRAPDSLCAIDYDRDRQVIVLSLCDEFAKGDYRSASDLATPS